MGVSCRTDGRRPAIDNLLVSRGINIPEETLRTLVKGTWRRSGRAPLESDTQAVSEICGRYSGSSDAFWRKETNWFVRSESPALSGRRWGPFLWQETRFRPPRSPRRWELPGRGFGNSSTGCKRTISSKSFPVSATNARVCTGRQRRGERVYFEAIRGAECFAEDDPAPALPETLDFLEKFFRWHDHPLPDGGG